MPLFVFLLIAGILAAGAVSSGSEKSGERTATYTTGARMGPSSTDPFSHHHCYELMGQPCPWPHPMLVGVPEICNDSKWQDQGIPAPGTVLFCAIPAESRVSVEVQDILLESPGYYVSCIHEEWNGVWIHKVLDDRQSETVTLAPSCAQHPDDPEGTTRVGVLLWFGETVAGHMTLNYEEGDA